MPPDDKAEILAAIAASESRTMAKIDTAAAQLRGEVGSIDGALRGGLDGAPGLLARMNAIEAAEARRDRIVFAAVIAVLGAIGSAIWQIITHRPPTH